MKWQMGDVNHLRPSCAEVKIERIYNSNTFIWLHGMDSKILKLPPQNRVLLEELIARHLFKNCPILYRPQLLFLFAEEIGLLATFCNILSFCYEKLLLPVQPSTVDQSFAVVRECLLYIFTDITKPYLEAVSST
jgi:hypothetical protein